MKEPLHQSRIAIVGMGCWYPGARNLKQLWENILARRRQFRRFPEQRLPLAEYYSPDPTTPDKTYGERAAVIDGFKFDWAGKRIPKTVVETADIAHWLALDVAISALDDAGYSRKTVPTERSGVLLGNSLTGEQTRSNNMRLRWPFVHRVLRAAAQTKGLPADVTETLAATMEGYYKSVFSPFTEDTLSGNLSNTIAGRICNFFDFHGGGYTVDGACSSSLIAVATAATALANRDLDMALAGGVDISLDTFELVGFAKTGALTRDDMTVYDKQASGFIPGEGAGFVVLKRLEDARANNDYIYAILNGWGISSDGKGGLTAPSIEGQAMALSRAYERAGYGLKDVTFIEGHGTGTPVGDRVELAGIAAAMTGAPQNPLRICGITSFKTLVGHTKAAAGIGGFIKATMAVNRRVIPPLAGCQDPNAVFDDTAKQLYPILQGAVHRPGEVLRAGVSAMGFGGINCHVTLESGDAPALALAPDLEEQVLLASAQTSEIFVVCGASIAALIEQITTWLPEVEKLSDAELADLAAHLIIDLDQRQPLRAAVVARSPKELDQSLRALIQLLESRDLPVGTAISNPHQGLWVGNQVKQTRLGFIFPGQGSQRLNMARTLVDRYNWARKLVNQADNWLTDIGAEKVSEVIYRPVDQALSDEQIQTWKQSLSRTEVSQVAICLTSLLWITYLAKLGLRPMAVGGHSLGELTAFYAAGAFDERTLLCLAAVRGQAMAAREDGAGGIMASLACSREKAASLLEEVPGYVVIANINSPQQTVISGEPYSVNQVSDRAVAQGIDARILPVSNGFHSRLVHEAAEYLRRYDQIPDSLTRTTVELFSCVDGKPPTPGLNLREHFANVVLSQVDFISLTQSLTERCDLLLEVGPARVLSGLVRDIAGPEGIPCCPVEPHPGDDRALNALLAETFVRGSDINWSALYNERLVRPFVSASERIFIDNPVERPLQSDLRPLTNGARSPESPLHQALLGQSHGLSASTLTQYLAQRGEFLADVIKADLHSLSHLERGNGNGHNGHVDPIYPHLPVRDGTIQERQIEGRATSNGTSARDILVNLIVQQTGYTPESVTSELRLLDDLNLDSIKAGEVVAETAQRCGVAGQIDPTTLANATIADIADAITALMPASLSGEVAIAGASVNGPVAIVQHLITLIGQQTGYPPESITADLRLLEDLNLDSIKASEVIADTARQYRVAGLVDPTTLANATLSEIADAIQGVASQLTGVNSNGVAGASAAPALPSTTSEPSTLQRQQLVRDYIIQSVPEATPAAVQGRQQVENWNTANALILCEAGEQSYAEAVMDRLQQQGTRVQISPYDQATPTQLNAPNVTHFIALLPHASRVELPTVSVITTMIERLRSIASPPQASRIGREHTTVAYVQFGGGHFATQAPITSLEQSCTLGFAASLHLERDDLKVRAIDFAPTVEAEALAERVFQELDTAHVYATAGYDAALERYVLQPQVQDPVDYHNREMAWSADDVIVVTGGGKGITAECAFALAQKTGVQMALVGRSPLTEPPSQHSRSEISRTLHRFQAAGLPCRYYSCDIVNKEAVNTLIQQIEQDLGTITGIIHGAALNKPRLIERVSTEEALDELSPKLVGLVNLYQGLGDRPLKLFAAFSSVIGFTGMQRNGWYGFANEALELVLRLYQIEHPETAVVAMAYSVWAEVGMGARMGSVRSLDKMGISAIPKQEGVRRFLNLIETRPADLRVVVAAPMQTLAAFESGGFDTWYPGLFTPPETSKFLEQILIYQPQVEVVLRAHLTPEKDSYLRDHLYKGSYLFPTVFGLESMAQAVAYVMEQPSFTTVQIEDIRLERPIVVAPERGTQIEIHAEVLERPTKDAPKRVHVTIKTEQTGFAISHFAATFVLDAQSSPGENESTIAPALPKTPLNIDPPKDLYTWLLFQGPRFQRLQTVFNLSAEQCVFQAYRQVTSGVSSDRAEGPFLLGDPYCRDSLLQSGQLVIPQALCLPIHIKRLELHQLKHHHEGEFIGVITPQAQDGQTYFSDVVLMTQSGEVLEKLHRYQSRILDHQPDHPTAAELANPSERDTTRVQQVLAQYADEFKLTPPALALAYGPDLHQFSVAERRQYEQPIFQQAIAQRMESDAAMPDIQWTATGKPMTVQTAGPALEVSLTHDAQLCLVVAEHTPQGCDIEPIVHRSRTDWLALLSVARNDLLEQLIAQGDELDVAGTRLWCAVEALQKASGDSHIGLTVKRASQAGVLLSHNARPELQVLTFPLELTRRPRRMVAVVMASAPVPSTVSVAEAVQS